MNREMKPDPLKKLCDKTDVEEPYNAKILDGGEISGFPPWRIACPNCELGTEVDPPQWNCEHCGYGLALMVGFAPVDLKDSDESQEGGDNLEGSK